MEQHAKSIDDRMTSLTGGCEQACLERDIHDVDHRRRKRQSRQIEQQRRLSGHAEAGCVHQKSRITLDLTGLFPGMNRYPHLRRREIARDRLGS